MTLIPIEQLDYCLTVLHFTKYEYYTHDALKENCFKDFDFDNIDMESLIIKLKNDSFIHYDISGVDKNQFKISIDGEIFYLAGGYAAEIKRKNGENIRLGKIESSQKNYRITQNVLLILVAGGTLVAAVYYATCLYWQYHWFR